MGNFYSLGIGENKVPSSFSKGVVRQKQIYLDEKGDYLFSKELFECWNKIYEEIEYFVVDVPGTPATNSEEFAFKGIATKFSRIKTLTDIKRFTDSYGLLGLATGNSSEIMHFKELKNISLLTTDTIPTVEPVNLWFDSVKQVKRLIKLYNALVKMHQTGEDNIEEDLLSTQYKVSDSVESELHLPGMQPFKYVTDSYYNVRWYDNTPTKIYLTQTENETLEPQQIYSKVLSESILEMINKSNILIQPRYNYSDVSPLGIAIIQCPYTPSLITAIYYDLWNMLNHVVQIGICGYSDCRRPFERIKNQKYCNNACKQAAHRKDKKNKNSTE